MVYAEKSGAKEKGFNELLEKTRQLVLGRLEKIAEIDPSAFEVMVFEMMTKAAIGTEFEETIRHTGDHVFPDIVSKGYFGVEVKMTSADKWISTGNSVLESLREEVERIFIMFGKMGGVKDIKYRLYQECLSEVSVTHSPRYRINMNLPSGGSIFEKIGIEYDTLRTSPNPIKKFKKYYRAKLKKGEELWWIDQEASPILRNFKSLTLEEKEKFIVESMILFPEIFSGTNWSKYEKPAAYLITKYNAYSASFRDKFSASGRVEREINGEVYKIPRAADNLYLRAKEIRSELNTFDREELIEHWNLKSLDDNVIDQWKMLIDKQFATFKLPIKLSEIFEAGLI